MQQPKPISRRYDDIIRNIENGIYQIPKFQRDFVWDKNKSAKLIESLLKGYPIGSFILWKTKERLKSLKKLGGEILKEIEEGDFVYYILDGQQRITSLYLAIKGLKIDKNDYKEIFIDLDKDIESDDEICVCECDKLKNSISFYDLMNRDILEISDEFGRDIANQANELKKRIENYEFATIEIENQSLDKIADIFTRINTSGKELTLFEIVNAKIYTEATKEQEGFDLEEKFGILIKDLERSGYESIAENKNIVLQLIALILERSAKREAILSIDKHTFIKNWDCVVECLKLAIDKIRDSLKIPASKLLPYYALIIPFAYFYYINNKKQPTKKQLENLHKYFFRAAFGERFSSSTESKLNEDTKLVEKICKNEKINFKQVDCDESKKYYEEELKYGFSTSSAFDKALLCILAYKDPRKFNDNSSVRLDNSWLNIASSKNYHHFFPKAYLKKLNKYDEDRINCLANITLVDDYINKRVIKDKTPSIYIKDFLKDNPDLEQSLETHYINFSDFGILDDDYDKFLNKRASVLADEILKRIKS